MRPRQIGTPARLAPVEVHSRGVEGATLRARLLHSGFSAAAAQLLTMKPTRAGLAWSVASPLTPYAETERELVHCGSTIAFNAHSPSGSLGDACDAFRRANGLKPINASFAAAANAAEKLAIRRLLLHDGLHVLLGFKADWPGQLGVFSFVAAQRYCPQFEWSARTLGQLYMTAAPWLREDLGDAEHRGRQLALSAPRLLSMPIEEEWGASLIALQVRWNIKSARSLGAIDWDGRATPSNRRGR